MTEKAGHVVGAIFMLLLGVFIGFAIMQIDFNEDENKDIQVDIEEVVEDIGPEEAEELAMIEEEPFVFERLRPDWSQYIDPTERFALEFPQDYRMSFTFYKGQRPNAGAGDLLHIPTLEEQGVAGTVVFRYLRDTNVAEIEYIHKEVPIYEDTALSINGNDARKWVTGSLLHEDARCPQYFVQTDSGVMAMSLYECFDFEEFENVVNTFQTK